MAGQEIAPACVAARRGAPLALILVVLALLTVLAGPAARAGETPREPPRQIIIAHAERQEAGHDPAAAMAATFKRLVEAGAPEPLRVEIFPDGQLGGNRDMTRLVSRNVIQSAIVTVGAIASLYPPIIITEMPFAFNTVEHAYAVYDGPFGRWLAADMAARTGLTVLGFGDIGGFFVLTTTSRPVRSPADLKGVRLRTIPGFPVLDALLRGMGATPVKVSSREEFQALATGVIDGQINPAVIILSRRYDTIQNFATVTNLLYAPYIWIFNSTALAALSPAEQALITSAAREAIAAGRATSRDQDHSGHGIPGLERRMQVYHPTPAERDAFKAGAQEQVKAYITTALGAEGVSLVQSFFAAIAETAPPQPGKPPKPALAREQ